MKKIICVFSALSMAFLFGFCLSKAKAARVEFSHNLDGKILSTDFSKDEATITVKYSKSDEYYGREEKELRLRIEESTKIVDESGKDVKKEDLKAGDEVSVVYRNKWNSNNKPLWKIAETITVKSKPDPDKKK